jgi:peroxiredoxin
MIKGIMTSMKRWIIGIVAVVCGMSMNAALPEVTLRDTDGKAVNVATLAQTGHPVIIAFFATWCKPCLQELKTIDEFYADWQEETGVTMYIVSIDQAQDIHKVRPLVDGFGWEYHVLLDPNGTLKRAMNVQNVPHMFVLDSTGRIVYNHQGYTDGDEEEIRELLH